MASRTAVGIVPRDLRAELGCAGERGEVGLALNVGLACDCIADVDRKGSDAYQEDGHDCRQERVDAALVTFRVPSQYPVHVSLAAVDCLSTSMRATYSRVTVLGTGKKLRTLLLAVTVIVMALPTAKVEGVATLLVAADIRGAWERT